MANLTVGVPFWYTDELKSGGGRQLASTESMEVSVDPISITLGAIAAAAIAKAQERAAEGAVDAGEGVLRRLATALRGRFSATGDEAASEALELVERDPTRPSSVDALAGSIDDHARRDAEFRTQLAALVDAVRRDPDASRFVTAVYGDAQVNKIVNINQAGDVSF